MFTVKTFCVRKFFLVKVLLWKCIPFMRRIRHTTWYQLISIVIGGIIRRSEHSFTASTKYLNLYRNGLTRYDSSRSERFSFSRYILNEWRVMNNEHNNTETCTNVSIREGGSVQRAWRLIVQQFTNIQHANKLNHSNVYTLKETLFHILVVPFVCSRSLKDSFNFIVYMNHRNFQTQVIWYNRINSITLLFPKHTFLLSFGFCWTLNDKLLYASFLNYFLGEKSKTYKQTT